MSNPNGIPLPSFVRTDLRSGSVASIGILALTLFACDADIERQTQGNSPTTWSDKEEVIYQLKELIRFEDMEAALKQDQLEALHQPSVREPANRP